MSDNRSSERKMVEATFGDIRAEASAMVKRAAGTPQPGESVKAQICRASIRTGLSWRKAKGFWYGEIANPKAEDIERLRSKIGSTRAEIDKARAMLDAAKRGINETNSELGGPHAGPRDAMVVALAEAMLRLAEKLTEGE